MLLVSINSHLKMNIMNGSILYLLNL